MIGRHRIASTVPDYQPETSPWPRGIMIKTPIERGFLLLHGWQNRRPAGHWQHWLADRLTDLGHQVGYPQLPDPDHPDLEQWLAELHRHLAALPGQDRTVICHSLACLLWLHAAARQVLPIPVDRVLLVAPPSTSFVVQHAEIAAFAAPPVTAEQLSAAAEDTRIVAGDNDPCCPEGAAVHYGRPLGLRTDVLPGAGHLDLEAGYGPWPSLLDWCRSPLRDAAIACRPGRAEDPRP
jgi:predicted alpha/beta hydrolase family esterase